MVKTGWPYDASYQGGPVSRPMTEELMNDPGYLAWVEQLAAQAANEPERTNGDHFGER